MFYDTSTWIEQTNFACVSEKDMQSALPRWIAAEKRNIDGFNIPSPFVTHNKSSVTRSLIAPSVPTSAVGGENNGYNILCALKYARQWQIESSLCRETICLMYKNNVIVAVIKCSVCGDVGG